MIKKYEIFYNDGAFYGKMTFKNKSQIEIENIIQKEIDSNNKNINPIHHITRNNFKEVQ